MKSREEIVEECASAARACFNHYSDESLTDDEAAAVAEALDELLPQSVSTEEWQEAADEYEARTAMPC